MDIVSENLKTHSDKIATEKRGKSSEDDKKKKMQGYHLPGTYPVA
jgi:hypothetical protein